MTHYILSAESDASDLEPFVLAVHKLVHHLPITARSLKRPGIRVESGQVIDRCYSGPVLLEAMEKNQVIRTQPKSGIYKGIPVIVSPIHDETGAPLGALGLVDTTGIFDLATFMEEQSDIIKQVSRKD